MKQEGSAILVSQTLFGFWTQFQCWGRGSTLPSASNSQTPAECLRIQPKSDTIYLEIAPIFSGWGVSPTRLPLTSPTLHFRHYSHAPSCYLCFWPARCRLRVPTVFSLDLQLLPYTLTNWLQIRGSQDLLLWFFQFAQNSGKHLTCTSLLKGMIKVTNQQPDEEIHRVRYRKRAQHFCALFRHATLHTSPLVHHPEPQESSPFRFLWRPHYIVRIG